ncbi:MAG: glycosyltransferase [Oxalobacteraceae bacterium]|nr:MAG: glycosyltransferase [Oxalobacteraceae bacterium]
MPNRFNISIVCLTYNQERYVADAVRSVLAQDFRGLEIVIFDDCSTDATFALTQDIVDRYDGPHTVRLHRNPLNLGITGNLSRAVADTSGDLIIFAAGDDISRADRASVLMNAWLTAGRGPTVLYSNCNAITAMNEPFTDTGGPLYPGPHRIEDMADGVLQVLGATSSITRDLLDDFAAIIPSAKYEDRIFPFRALLKGGKVVFIDQPLIDYRLHVGVSQQRAADAREYLLAHSLRDEQTRLADAIQRLTDLMTVAPERADLRRRCERTILTHEARIASAQGDTRFHERVLWNNLLLGGSRMTALKLYAKHRFYPLARHFIKI